MSFRSPAKLARFAVIAALGFAAMLSPANANPKNPVALSVDRDRLAIACGAAGGKFNSGPGGYSCTQTKKGGRIDCDPQGTCLGSCENNCANVAKGINGILHPPPSAGTVSAVPINRKIPVGSIARVNNSVGHRR